MSARDITHNVDVPFHPSASPNCGCLNTDANGNGVLDLTGVLVDQIEYDDPSGGGRAVRNVRNRGNQSVASGVFVYHVATPAADERVGKFTVLISTQ
jgi:hypothetical protein